MFFAYSKYKTIDSCPLLNFSLEFFEQYQNLEMHNELSTGRKATEEVKMKNKFQFEKNSTF
jgi:hypothetical protein